jgi:hypothetical protein
VWQEHEADHSPVSNYKVKNAWICTSRLVAQEESALNRIRLMLDLRNRYLFKT